jgi:hypothetical protein
VAVVVVIVVFDYHELGQVLRLFGLLLFGHFQIYSTTYQGPSYERRSTPSSMAHGPVAVGMRRYGPSHKGIQRRMYMSSRMQPETKYLSRYFSL